MNQRYDVVGFGMAMLAVALFVWTGLAGAILDFGPRGLLYDYQTLIGALLAVFAAFIALRPAYKQLAELRAQSDQRSMEMLAERSLELDADRNAMYMVWSGAEIVEKEIAAFLTKYPRRSGATEQDLERLRCATDMLDERVTILTSRRGFLWGPVEVFAARNECIDAALMASISAGRAVKNYSAEEFDKFKQHRQNGLEIAAALELVAKRDADGIARRMAWLERKWASTHGPF